MLSSSCDLISKRSMRPARWRRRYDSDALDESLKKQGVEMIAPHPSSRTLKAQDGRALRRYRRRWNV